MFNTKAITQAAGMILTLGLAGTAQAGEYQDHSWDVRQTRVSFQDLDLSTPEGGEALLRRVRKAATRVCQGGYDGTLEGRADYRRCRSEAIEEAVGKANRPMLTAAHQGGRSISLAQAPQAKAGG